MGYVVRVRAAASRKVVRLTHDASRLTSAFLGWVRSRSTSILMSVLLAVQAVAYFSVTQPSFFFHDDYNYFKLAEERGFFHYLLTPILSVYPAPGDRFASLLLQRFAPLNFTVARAFLLLILAGTTVLLWRFVRTLARSDRWWTVALVVPFALSLTLVLPMGYWSAGLPIVPALFFTVVALSAWLRSYEDPAPGLWVGVAVVAVAAAGAFYLKFLLIPAYLFLFRVLIVPRLMTVPEGIRGLWQERMRWVALAVPPAAFIAVFVLSGLAGRSAAEGSRPFVDYFTTAWFRAFVPAAFLNARPDGSTLSLSPWILMLCSQVLFWGAVVATWRRSSLALRGWVFFIVVFVLNAAMIGGVRLATFGVDQLARTLRYYPEAVLFLPVALALGLRQGAERRPRLAWERTRFGQIAIASTTLVYVVGLLVWAPGMVSDSAGVRARVWYENLRRDLDAVTVDGAAPRIVDSETPEYVYEYWREPDNRVATVLGLLPLDVVFNELDDPIFLVREDGHLAEATFRPTTVLLSGASVADGVRIAGGSRSASGAICLRGGAPLRYLPETDLTGIRLAMRVSYASKSDRQVNLVVDVPDPDRPFRYLALRPFQSDAELIDLATSQLRGLTLEPSPGDEVCIERMEIGVLTGDGS